MDGIDLVDYSRQEELDRYMVLGDKDNYINLIIGCGGIGYWVGIFLAMLGYDNFILVDGDKLDNSNLNRLPVPQTFIGLNKAIILRKHIQQIRPSSKTICMTKHISTLNVDMLFELSRSLRTDVYMYRSLRTILWDCTDSLETQRLLFKECENRSINYTKLCYEGLNIGAYNNYNVWDDGTQTRGYRTSKANVLSSAMAAGFGIIYQAIHNNEGLNDFNLDIVKLLKAGGKIYEPKKEE